MLKELLLSYLQHKNDVESIDHQTEEGTSKHFYPSEVFLCKRKRYLSRIPNVEKTEEAPSRLIKFVQGKFWEDIIEEMLKQETRFVDKQVRVEIPEWDMAGNADFIALNEKGEAGVVELKTCHPFALDKLNREGLYKHVRAQAWIYFKHLKDKYDLKWCRVFYISIADSRTMEFCIINDNWTLDSEFAREVKEDAEYVVKCYQIRKLPEPLPRVFNKKGTLSPNWQCGYCPYYTHNCKEEIQ